MYRMEGLAGANVTMAVVAPSCAEWPATGHALVQAANACYAAAFLAPHRLLLRSSLALGFLLASLWAALEACAPDLLAWNLAFLLTNGGHALYLAWVCIPPRFVAELEELYSRLFLPFKVSRRHFKELIREVELHELEAGDPFSEEGITRADQGLSVLLSGRLKVTCQGVLLHYVDPWEFVDSPEWEATPSDTDGLFQVTIKATSRCRYAHWPRTRLTVTLASSPYLSFILRCLVGRDVAHKLYSLAEVDRSPQPPAASLARSRSVDYVHTGSEGRVRSALWRRGSSAVTENLGAPQSRSPATLTVPQIPL
ncbi:BVES [Cordylochernes scorpioides]|uniref:BVES n=1 Tax=Cordylochernes scorpioides TaxID=51811 RepID=A0ABY6JXQ6_9ARAC|nr:BVES [Cordylochernes scorpioides]